MAGGGAEIWVCASCRSVNKLRAKQCYNCRTPKDRAAVDPTTMAITSHGPVREISLPDFRSSRPFAILASFMIVTVGVMQVITTLVTSSTVVRILDGNVPTESELANTGLIALASTGVALLALIAWAAWLSKAVRTMPALGLGYPSANGLMAFVENFIPVLNLYRVPAIVRDIARRLEPTGGRGDALISAAWVGLIGGYILNRFGSIFSALTSETLGAAYRRELVVMGVTTGLMLVGATFLVVLIWWIEVRIRRRRKQQLADGAAASARDAEREVRAEKAASEPPIGSAPLTAAAPLNVPLTEVAPAFTPLPLRPEPPVPSVPVGPRLHVAVADDASMEATLDDESEPITLEELRAAATALAEADGSAVVMITGAHPAARTRADEALRVLLDAGVPATLET